MYLNGQDVDVVLGGFLGDTGVPVMAPVSSQPFVPAVVSAADARFSTQRIQRHLVANGYRMRTDGVWDQATEDAFGRAFALGAGRFLPALMASRDQWLASRGG